MDCVIKEIKESESAPSLLLHACCAPCSSYVLEYLSEYFQITVLFYNPNISSKEEYCLRLQEMKRLISQLPAKNPISLVEGDYVPDDFYEIAKGLEKCPERGERCLKCYKLRLEYTAKRAKKMNADFFATTLTLSPLKNAQALNDIGEELAVVYDTPYLPSDFKKRGGYLRSIELSKEYGLYRQNFCGCVYSKSNNN